MPIIKARTGRIDTVRYVSRLQKPNRDALVAYASFIGDTPDYLLKALIGATLAKDGTSWRGRPSTGRQHLLQRHRKLPHARVWASCGQSGGTANADWFD